MNRIEALSYVLASSPTASIDDLDLRVAAYMAAMFPFGMQFEQVGPGEAWNARCQLGMLLGRELPAVNFGMPLPCGKAGRLRPADMTEFTDPRHRPERSAVYAALRRLALLRHGMGKAIYCSEHGQERWVWQDVDVRFSLHEIFSNDDKQPTPPRHCRVCARRGRKVVVNGRRDAV